MSEELRPYVIKQGDYLAKLAYVYGFDAEEVWNHEKNVPLRERRKEPQILYPGDILYIPGTDSRKRAAVTAELSNQFVANVRTTPVALLLKVADQPITHATCLVTGLSGEQEEYYTDGGGVLRVDVAPHISLFRIAVPSHHVEYRVRVGEMDPANSPLGVAKRLANMGYLASDIGDLSNHTATLVSAIKVFQTANDLDPSGLLDKQTTSAIEAAHGS